MNTDEIDNGKPEPRKYEHLLTKEYYSSTDIARMLGVCRQRVNQMIHEEKIKPSIKTNNMFLFTKLRAEKILEEFKGYYDSLG